MTWRARNGHPRHRPNPAQAVRTSRGDLTTTLAEYEFWHTRRMGIRRRDERTAHAIPDPHAVAGDSQPLPTFVEGQGRDDTGMVESGDALSARKAIDADATGGCSRRKKGAVAIPGGGDDRGFAIGERCGALVAQIPQPVAASEVFDERVSAFGMELQ